MSSFPIICPDCFMEWERRKEGQYYCTAESPSAFRCIPCQFKVNRLRGACIAMSRFLAWVYLERLSHVRLELRPDLWDIHRERALNLCDFGKALGLRITWSDS